MTIARLHRRLAPATLAAALFVGSAALLSSWDSGQANPSAQGQQQPAGGIADPVAWVRQAYAPSREPASDARNSANPAYTPRLRALFADEEKHPDGEIGRLEFNYMTGAQDDQISDVKVGARNVDGAPDRRIVTASFRNIGEPTTIDLLFDRIGERWYLDDVHSLSGGWTLSLILKYGLY